MIDVKDYIQQQNNNEEYNSIFTIENFKKYGNLLKKTKWSKEEFDFVLKFSNAINKYNESKNNNAKNIKYSLLENEEIKNFKNNFKELNTQIKWLYSILYSKNKNHTKKGEHTLYNWYVENVHLTDEEKNEYYEKKEFFDFVKDSEFNEIIQNGYKYVLDWIFWNLKDYKNFADWWSKNINENIIKNIDMPDTETGVPQIDLFISIVKAIQGASAIFEVILYSLVRDFNAIKTEIIELKYLENSKTNLIYIRNRYYSIWEKLKNHDVGIFIGYWEVKRNSYWMYEKINDLLRIAHKRYSDYVLGNLSHY